MGKKDARIDTYISQSSDFAKPVLRRLRTLIHQGCPDVEETLKWGHPSFLYKGILCGFASFKKHCTFGFWKGPLILGNNQGKSDEAMGQFGRLTSVSDLPKDRVLVGFIKMAVLLNEFGVKAPVKKKPAARKRLYIPELLTRALKKNPKAKSTFDAFSYSNKKEYVEWLTEAKTEETQTRRLATAVKWMAQGKARNWKYAQKKGRG